MKKVQTEENVQAKHDLLTALRVAMRKMIEEAIWLTDMNAKDTKRQIREEINHKKSKAQKEYRAALEK